MLTLNSPTVDIDFTLTDGVDSVRQRVRQRLLFLFGEWFLATQSGVPHLQEILGNPDDLDVVRRVITDHILAVEDVTGVQDVTVALDSERKRTVNYTAKVNTIYGTFATAGQAN